MILFSFWSCQTGKLRNDLNDSYRYLEEVKGEKALRFAKEKSAQTLGKFQSDLRYQKVFDGVLEVLNDPEKLITPGIKGEYVIQFWRDKKHKRGVIRRIKLKDYVNGNRDWRIVFDLDQVAKNENENWVMKGWATEEVEKERIMIFLSRGGKDASVVREYDLEKRSFVKDGFSIPEGKSRLDWLNKDTLLVSVALNEEEKNRAGYPTSYRLLKRGAKLDQAPVLYQISKEDTFVYAYIYNPENPVVIFRRSIDRQQHEYFFWDQENRKNIKLDIPTYFSLVNFIEGQLVFINDKPWKHGPYDYPSGSVLAFEKEKLLKGDFVHHQLFVPSKRQSVIDVDAIKGGVFLEILEDVRPRVAVHLYRKERKDWMGQDMKLPSRLGKVKIYSTSDDRENFFLGQETFLTPDSLYFYEKWNVEAQLIDQQKTFFNADGLKESQFFATSRDGTKVPYFFIGDKNDSKRPTLIYAYGGFESSQLPFYSGTFGRYVYQQGMNFVLANLRGGGEYGPDWHQAGVKTERQNIFDDLYSVAEDLVKRNLAPKDGIAFKGGSNGGLLATVAFTQKPNLFRAIISSVPLTDMERYHKLLAGHLWMAEYGDPEDPEEGRFLKSYSPFHQIKEGREYPSIFVNTSTLDDRVHPAHARKFVAKLDELGIPYDYYENTEGGHGGASNYDQSARKMALEMVFLYRELGVGRFFSPENKAGGKDEKTR